MTGSDIEDLIAEVDACDPGDAPMFARELLERVSSALSSLRAEKEELAKALEWYGEQARLARLIHSEGDKGRHALSNDGGKRARSVLVSREGKR